MAARRCEDCVIQYPLQHLNCEVCGAPTEYKLNASPDMNWQSKVDLLVEQAAPPPPIPVIACNVVKDEHGRLWLYNIDLRQSFRADVPSFQLFKTPDGLIVEVQGGDAPRARYLVEVVQ
jgi:hypothetical protein